MTEHDEAVRLVRLFGRTLNFDSGTEYSFTPAQLAALIAEVDQRARRDEREMIGAQLDRALRSDDYGAACAAIRAKLEK